MFRLLDDVFGDLLQNLEVSDEILDQMKKEVEVAQNEETRDLLEKIK